MIDGAVGIADGFLDRVLGLINVSGEAGARLTVLASSSRPAGGNLLGRLFDGHQRPQGYLQRGHKHTNAAG